MRILHVIPSISPLNGGPSFALHALVRSLAGLGESVDVATSDDHGAEHLAAPVGRPLPWDGVNYYFFPRVLRVYTTAPSIVPWLQKNIARYDLVHIHALFSFTSAATAWSAHLHRVPYIIQPHGALGAWGLRQRRPLVKKLSMQLMELPILRRARLIYMNTPQEVVEMHEYGIHLEAEVLNYAISLPDLDRTARAASFFGDHPDLAGRPLVLFLSRLHPKKGLDLLFPAFKSLLTSLPDATLLLAGEGDPDYTAQLRTMADNLEISNAVRFLGFLSGQSKWAALSAAGVFVLPSYSENFGIAVIEAMAPGTPVVVSDQAAVCKEVERSGGGLVVPCQVEALLDAMKAILLDPDKRQQLGNAARIGASRFSAGRVAEETRALYQRVLGIHGDSEHAVERGANSLLSA